MLGATKFSFSREILVYYCPRLRKSTDPITLYGNHTISYNILYYGALVILRGAYSKILTLSMTSDHDDTRVTSCGKLTSSTISFSQNRSPSTLHRSSKLKCPSPPNGPNFECLLFHLVICRSWKQTYLCFSHRLHFIDRIILLELSSVMNCLD